MSVSRKPLLKQLWILLKMEKSPTQLGSNNNSKAFSDAIFLKIKRLL